MTPARDRWIDAAWLLAVGLATSAWCAAAWPHLGATFDEPAHFAIGLKSWRTGSIKQQMTWGAMPLPLDVQSLPAYLWERHRGEPFDPVLDFHRLLPLARVATLVFWWLLLLYGLRWGKVLGGPWAGRLACALIGADPNLLGHAALATTDIALTAMVLVATYHFYVARDSGWLRRVVVPGVLYGLALATKASALPYVPILFVLFGLSHLHAAGRLPVPGAGSLGQRVKGLWAATLRLRWDVVYAFWIGIVVVFGYCGCDWQNEPTFVKWARQLPDGDLKRVMVPVSENLPIFTNAGEGLVQQIKHNIRGHHGSYLLGRQYERAVWYYFPVALSIKLAEPTLVLLGLVLLIRPRGLRTPAGWAALALLLFSLNTRVQIGVRLLFPFVVFLHVALAAAVYRRKPVLPFSSPERKGGETPEASAAPPSSSAAPPLAGEGFIRLAGWLTFAVSALIALSYWPDGLRHTNHLWGDPDRGYELLTDSNYDWGQGLPELAEWSAAHDRPRLVVWYYGTDPAVQAYPFLHLRIHMLPVPEAGGAVIGSTFPVRHPSLRSQVEEYVGDGYLAVGVSLLYGTPDRRPEILAVAEWLKSLQPVARTRTFLIYKLR